MVLFFDRSVGKTIPEMLIALKIPIQVEYHQKHFIPDEEDDVWLPIIGNNGWVVIGHDQYHRKENELMAIKQYDIGCFYLWGAEHPK
jgi:hypothetical protein